MFAAMLRLDSSTAECRGYMLLSAAEDAAAKDGDELFARFFSAVATLPEEETWSSLQQVLAANAAKAASNTPVRIVSGVDGDEPLTPQCAQNVAAAAVRAVRVSLPAGIGTLLVSRETCGTSCNGTSCAHPEDVPASVVDAEKTAFKKLFAQLEDTWIFKLLRGDDGAVAVEPSGGGGGSSGDSSSGCGDCVCARSIEGDARGGGHLLLAAMPHRQRERVETQKQKQERCAGAMRTRWRYSRSRPPFGLLQWCWKPAIS